MPALTYVYGATIGIGGIFGYLAKGSKPSLGFGVMFGALICWCALRMKDRGPGVRGYPYMMVLALSMMLFAMSATRLSKSGKMMPMGIVAIMSFVMSARYVSHFTIYSDLYEYGV
mmetsp:Transcript_35155/g.80021  ORF Transcript_35155/g.80021 Transcript_35155/m.80021 type:complete len:115 (+) Transcript_35155:80-424(+)